MNTKKISAMLLALTIFSSAVFADPENVAVWGEIYNTVSTDDQRIAVLLVIMDFEDRDFNPVLAKALEDVIARQLEKGTPTEVLGKTQIARLIVQEMGILKSSEYSALVNRVYRESKNIPLKSDAALTLGQMRAVEYAPSLAQDLRALNATPGITEKRDQEILAMALVRSLNEMRDPSGYDAVFMATLSWYSSFSKVRETARDALVTMVDDPSEKLLEIMVKNQDIEVKNAALEAVLISKAGDDKKRGIATRALTIGLEYTSLDQKAVQAATRLRIAALTALAGLGDKDAANVPLYIRIVLADKKNESTFDETIKAYVALGVNGSNEAAAFLAQKMAEHNELEKRKANSTRDKLLIRQILASMTTAKNPAVRNVLMQAQFIDHDAGILALIKETLNSLPK
jgi:hypothetical protein